MLGKGCQNEQLGKGIPLRLGKGIPPEVRECNKYHFCEYSLNKRFLYDIDITYLCSVKPLLNFLLLKLSYYFYGVIGSKIPQTYLMTR